MTRSMNGKYSRQRRSVVKWSSVNWKKNEKWWQACGKLKFLINYWSRSFGKMVLPLVQCLQSVSINSVYYTAGGKLILPLVQVLSSMWTIGKNRCWKHLFLLPEYRSVANLFSLISCLDCHTRDDIQSPKYIFVCGLAFPNV